MTEPYFGADLEMELGDSFIASIFGGWIPVPIEEEHKFRHRGTFEGGLAWRQHLTWDHHKTRPIFRTHYSIPVAYIAALFSNSSWAVVSRPETLVRPPTLPFSCRKSVDMDTSVSEAGLHASAALPDFVESDGGLSYKWKRRPAAEFRIPWYQDVLCHGGAGGAGPRCWIMPDEPDAFDKVLSHVQIRLEVPSSEISPCVGTGGHGGSRSLRHMNAGRNWSMTLGRNTVRVPGSMIFHISESGAPGAGLDLRKMTGEKLRRRFARALDLPLRHVKLRVEYGSQDGGRDEANDAFGPSVLSAYARRAESDGLALSLFFAVD
ncbi:hypothetical protein B0H63DRAFT_464934 [Podospora didyma]|uniref:Uncharacterized protein n=1 Tax=Podospora didyma TaxID=330526 RepID=A0AAE0NZ15_9PEZI|nr:hypothetical protein B0H63DRAFT_464934 [Podospora didyma]